MGEGSLRLLLLLLLLQGLLAQETEQERCNEEEMSSMGSQWRDCVEKYKAEYDTANPEEQDDWEAATCRLLHKLVEVCGNAWARCYSSEEVRERKDLHLNSMISNNNGSNVDMEVCPVVQFFRDRQGQAQEQEEEPDQCTEEQLFEAQANFQNCSHAVTTNLVEYRANKSLLCSGLGTIRASCSPLLSSCLSPGDVATMLEAHLTQVATYLGVDGFCKEENKSLVSKNDDIKKDIYYPSEEEYLVDLIEDAADSSQREDENPDAAMEVVLKEKDVTSKISVTKNSVTKLSVTESTVTEMSLYLTSSIPVFSSSTFAILVSICFPLF